MELKYAQAQRAEDLYFVKKLIVASLLFVGLALTALSLQKREKSKEPVKEKTYLEMTSKEIIDELGVPDYLASNNLTFTFSYGRKRELRVDFYGPTHRCIGFQGALSKDFEKTPRPKDHYYNGQTIEEFQQIYGKPEGPPEVISSAAVKLDYLNLKEVLLGHHQLVFVRKP